MSLISLEKIINAAMIAKNADSALQAIGYTETPYFQIYGNLVDAIYNLLGEHTDELEQSITFRVMQGIDLTPKQKAELLLAVFKNT